MFDFNFLFREASAAIGQRLHDAATEAVRQVTMAYVLLLLLLLLLLFLLPLLVVVVGFILSDAAAGLITQSACGHDQRRRGGRGVESTRPR
jgi:hypothetical protein